MNKFLLSLMMFFCVELTTFCSMRNPFFLQDKKENIKPKDMFENIIFYGTGKNNKKMYAFIKINNKPSIISKDGKILNFKIIEINKEYILLSNNKKLKRKSF